MKEKILAMITYLNFPHNHVKHIDKPVKSNSMYLSDVEKEFLPLVTNI